MAGSTAAHVHASRSTVRRNQSELDIELADANLTAKTPAEINVLSEKNKIITVMCIIGRKKTMLLQ